MRLNLMPFGTGLIFRTVAIVLFFRPPATAECRFQAKPFRHDACPSVAAIRLAPLQARADCGQLRVVLGLIHETSPRGGPGQRPIAEYLTRLRRTVDPLPMAAPSPVLGAANQGLTPFRFSATHTKEKTYRSFHQMRIVHLG